MSHPDASGSANGLPSFSKNNPDARASGTAPQGPESTASGGALGSNRELFHPRVSRQALNCREMRADQRAASAIYFKEYRNLAASGASHDDLKSLPAAGVGGCGLSQIAEMETLLQRREISEGQFKAFVSGVRVCGLRWVCQHCAAKAAEDDRKAVNAGIAAGRARGLIPVMLTLTTRHSREDEAGTLLNAIARAEQRVKRLKCWENLPFAGYARVLEWTYGENGHHPHFHTILLMRAGSEAEAVEMVKRIQPSHGPARKGWPGRNIKISMEALVSGPGCGGGCVLSHKMGGGRGTDGSTAQVRETRIHSLATPADGPNGQV